MRVFTIIPPCPYSGAGVLEKEVSSRLAARGRVDVVRVERGVHATGLRGLAGRAQVLQDAVPGDIVLATSSPLPILRRGVRVVAILYDIRWRWTRSRAAQVYRAADLIRTLRRADKLFVISRVVQAQLAAVSGRSPESFEVLPLGPGQFEGAEVPDRARETDLILIQGRGKHKENVLALDLLEKSGAIDDFRLCCVGVDREVASKAATLFKGGRLQRVDSFTGKQLATLYVRSAVTLQLGISEGFGLPLLEASMFGCPTICQDVAITREVLGGTAIYLRQRDGVGLADVLYNRSLWPKQDQLVAHAKTFSWERSVDAIARVLSELAP